MIYWERCPSTCFLGNRRLYKKWGTGQLGVIEDALCTRMKIELLKT